MLTQANLENGFCSNYRFSLGPLPCSRVAKIDSFTWKQTVSIDYTSNSLKPKILNSITELPNVRLSISMADVKAWEDWFLDSVIQGNCTVFSGGITFLGRNLIDELAEIELHAGILSIQPNETDANTPEPSRFIVELYIDEMKFKYVESL